MADTNFRSKAELINFLIAKYGYKSYLEIGIRNGANYKREPLKINCSHVGWETFVANKKGLLNLVSPKNWKY